jgi:cell wall assembly regulator SMI1
MWEKISEFTTFNPGAEQSDIEKAQLDLGVNLPLDYCAVLRHSNGFIGRRYIFYMADELTERNSTYEVPQYMPNWLLIGDDGGGYGIALRLTDKPSKPYLIEHGVMMEEFAILQAESLEKWISDGLPFTYSTPNNR